jgi:hypothetical protein
MTFPWIKEKVINKELIVYLWFFDIKTGQIFAHSDVSNIYEPLVVGITNANTNTYHH